MAHLSVNSRILKYKKTSYQISQMTSIKPGRVTRKKHIEYVSVEHLPLVMLVGAVLAFIGLAALSDGEVSGFLFLVFGGAALFYCYKIWRTRREQNKIDPRYVMYGLSVRMSNGDKEFFLSSDEPLIDKIHNAIVEAMNGVEGVSISFENANIEISDSDNIQIGNLNNDQ